MEDAGARRLILRRAWRGFLRHRGYDSAAALTFFTAVTVLPAVLLGISIFGLLDQRRDALKDIVTLLGTFFSDEAAKSVGQSLGGLLSVDHPWVGLLIGAALTLWTVSGYATAFGRAINSVYEVQEGRPFWLFRGQMLLVAALLITLGAALVACYYLAPTAITSIFDPAELGVLVWTVVRWPLMLALMAAIIAALYTFAPTVQFTKRRWATVGTVIAIIAWVVATAGFGVYVAVIGAYGHIYGRAGILLVALLWFYLSNIALVVGAEVDAEFVRMKELEAGTDASAVIRLPIKHAGRLHMLARQHSEDVEDSRQYLRPPDE